MFIVLSVLIVQSFAHVGLLSGGNCLIGLNHCESRGRGLDLLKPLIDYWPLQYVLLWFLSVTYCYVRVYMVSSHMVT